MKALLKLVETYDDAVRTIHLCDTRGVRIAHKKYGGPPYNLCLNEHVSPSGDLKTYFSFNHGGYGSSISLREGSNLLSNWRMEGAAAQVPNHKQLTGVSVCFLGTTWERDLEEQRTLVTKRGGHLKDKPGKGVDVVVVGKGADRDQSAQSYPDALVVTEESFQRVLPKPRTGPKGRRAPTKRMGGDARSLFKLLSSRDVEQINQGLFLADSLKDGDVIDDLLSDVGVDEHGDLSRGRRFTGTGPHQPFLDHALMGLLAVCVPGSKGAETRESLQSITLDGALAAPVMKGFSSLKRLSIVMGKGASISDLTGWGPLPALRFLFIIGDRSYGGWAKERPLLSLKGLVAPELEELRISHNPITDIDPLSECRHLRKVDLSSCGSLESVAPLSNATELEWISLKYCSSLTSFEPLRGASRLAHCDLRGLTDVGSLSALAGKPGLRELGLTNCFFESTAPLADIDSWAPLSETGSGGHSTKLQLRLTGWGDLTGLRGLDPTVETLEITVKGSGAGHAPLAGVPVRLSSVDGGLEILEVGSLDAGDASAALKTAEADFAAYAKTPRGEARKALLRERGEGALWGLAAELGSGDACFLMAKAYDVGLGASRGSGLDRFPEISGDAAGLWYHRGAVRGNGFCQGNHGGLVPEGAQALGWYRLAAAQGVESAQYNLANLLARRGDPASMSEALYWAKKTSGGSLAQQVQGTLGELQSKGVEARSPAELSIDDGASESTQGRLLKSKELELPLRSGDVITAIDGVSVVGVPHSEAVGPLHGAFGSAVSLSVQRSDGTTEDVSVVRRWLNHSLSPVDLSSLPPLPGVKKIHLTHRGLQSLNGLSALSNLEYFTLEGAPLEILDMGPLPHLKVAKMVGCGSLRDLGGLEAQRKGLLAILENCPSLTSTAGLGNAQWVNIQKCPGLNNLEGFADNPAVQSGEQGWYGRDVRAVSSSTLRSSPCFSAVVQDQWKSGERVSPVLDLGNTALTDLSSLGPAARPGIPGVDLAGCASLVSLKGLEVFEDLCFLDLRGCGQLSDVGSLGERKGPLCVLISVDGDALPGGVMAALAALQELHLVVIDQDHALKDLSALKGLKGLRGLDLVESGYRDTLDGSKTTALSIQSLSPLVSAADLRALRLPGSCLPPRCGPVGEGTTSQGSIRNFRKGLAKALGVSLPKEETAPKKPAPKGLRSTVSKLRKLLTAADFSSIQQGVELLCAAGIPEAWDALVGGMDPGSAFISGNGKEDMAGMGTVFSRGRVVDAPYARYASLCVLATAPEEATEAAAIRDQVRSIQINVTEGQDYGGFKSALPPLPSLMKFTGLKAVTVFGTLEGETLDGLGVPSLEILCLPEIPALKDVSALQTCSDLKSLSLGTSDLQTLSGCESLPTLEHVALASPKLASLKALSAAKGLKSLKLHGCASLDTLSGIESAEELSAFHCTECPALVDLGALGGKEALSRTVHPSAVIAGYGPDRYWQECLGDRLDESGKLHLIGAGPVSDLSFLGAQEGVVSLEISVGSEVDLRPVGELVSLDEALVHLRTGDVHLRGLERIRTLTLTGPGQPSEVGAMPKLTNLKLCGESPSLSAPWPELPSLTDVVVTQAPLTSLDWLNAPNLRAVDLKEANLESCEGFGQVSVLSLAYSSWSSSRQPVMSSLRGLENNEGIRTLDVRGFDSGTDLSVLSTLRSLESIEAGSNIAIQSLRETATVTWLSLEDYQGGDDGSLAFLAGWSALKIVVLLNSGTLTDLEALAGLPNLETIQLRGSSTKRPQWPDALQDKLDFTSGSWTYRNPVK